MKKIFLFTVALLSAITMKAQVVSETISATLQDGETTTVYYGTDALKTALNNAADGSIITLSSGTFARPDNIMKSVKIYGAGYEDDPITGVARTFLDGDIYMRGVEGVHLDNFYMEGVYVNGEVITYDAENDEQIEGVKLVKCRTTNIQMRENSDATIIRQCFVEGSILGNNTVASGFMVQNCYVSGEINGFNTESAIVVDHCILPAAGLTGRWGDVRQYHGPYYYKNTILNRYLTTGAVAVNCVGYADRLSNDGRNTVTNCYTDISNWEDLMGAIFADRQKDLNYMLTDNSAPRTWEVADPDTYKGDDGTVIGLAGGTYVWNKIPSTPRIISSTIDSKTVNGKLHVNIKAEARPVVE